MQCVLSCLHDWCTLQNMCGLLEYAQPPYFYLPSVGVATTDVLSNRKNLSLRLECRLDWWLYQYNNLILVYCCVGVVSSEVCDGMHDCVWTRAVFIGWNLLEDTAQLQPWPRSLAYCQEVKGICVGLNLCSKTVSWADVLFAYSCTATSPFLQWKVFLGTI